MKEKFHCRNCDSRFNDTDNIPRILPCDVTICDHCIATRLDLKQVSSEKSSSQLDYQFSCVYCSKMHDLTFATKEKLRTNLPLNEKIMQLMRKRCSIEVETKDNQASNREKNSQFMNRMPISSSRVLQNSHRKMSTIIDDFTFNTNELNSNIKNSKEKLLFNFSQIESEIIARAEKLINEINDSKQRMINELNLNKENAMARLEEALETNVSIKSFQQEYAKMCAKLNDKNKNDDLDKNELRKIAFLAEDLNEKIVKTNLNIKKMTEKNALKFIKPATVTDTASLIGRIQSDDLLFNKVNYAKKESERERKPNTISYKVHVDAINVSIHALNEKKVLKVTELTENDNDYDHLINFQLINSINGNVLLRNTEQIGMYRVKKTHANQNYIAVLLVNQFIDNQNCLQLYNETDLKLVNSIELNYKPIDMYLSENGVYVISNKNISFIHKYNLDLKHIKSFGQSSKEKEPFYIPKYFKLESVVHEEALSSSNHVEQKLYFVDYENLRIRIMNEATGKYLKKINILTDEQFSSGGTLNKNILIQIDTASQRIVILNRKMSKITVLNWDGMFLSQRIIDTHLQTIDKFFLIKDNLYSVVDYENQLVHFF